MSNNNHGRQPIHQNKLDMFEKKINNYWLKQSYELMCRNLFPGRLITHLLGFWFGHMLFVSETWDIELENYLIRIYSICNLGTTSKHNKIQLLSKVHANDKVMQTQEQVIARHYMAKY